ncbi:tripartite tricarboxylate transporter substrate binding protein [Verticiella sediminum]|uniref:Tripartite tricarboxylate transporter substrate binding protein n=1 Tax=Verticiella sediminum TaxID=1247510 RepID=A0A556AU87_9BURK|nr:tripartite tricarboxylate transporter substrate binding protein [Verticiella sediminum]TSH96501.1 tripartite tricarboxylate transporter substrate binding protein [Verticiella sediminum]
MQTFIRAHAVRWLSTALLGAAFAAGTAGATPWPERQVRVVVGFAPGGTTDVMARLVAQALGDQLGQQFVVENKPGASGNIAAHEVVRANADGYTLLVAPTSVETANPSLFKASFHPAQDLAPVASVGRTQMYLVARPDLPVADAAELVALAKARPDTLSYSSSGTGTPPHLAAELFKQQAGIQATHVPYGGAAPALRDVMASQADYVFDPGIAFPHIRTGKVKLLGVASDSRSPFFPDVPTLAEQGIAGAGLDIWFGVWAPRDTPAEVKTALAAAVAKAAADPAFGKRFNDLGAEPVALDTAAFAKLLAEEGELISGLVKSRDIRVE